MYVDRRSDEYIDGLKSFLRVAVENKWGGFMCWPCVVCQNKKDSSSSDTLHIHLLQFGFMASYNCWTKHGERGVMIEYNKEEEEDDDTCHMFP
jgi:hypothetical protein